MQRFVRQIPRLASRQCLQRHFTVSAITGTLGDNLPPLPGDRAEVRRTFTSEDIKTFANLCGDHNPVHLDEEFAKQTRFGGTISHGILCASLFSGIFGTCIPGSIYGGQNLKFTAPSYVGHECIASVEIESTRNSSVGLFVKCKTQVRDVEGKMTVDGEATVLIPKEES